jgi:hypothetical protein
VKIDYQVKLIVAIRNMKKYNGEKNAREISPAQMS